jgi:signal transduction histidine kinase
MRMASSSCIELCMPARPTRSLAVGPDAGVLAVVQDAGVGFERASLDQLFEPLYTTKPDGLGMGLSISRSIIVAHGGRLWATPNARHGATFQFVLPAWKGQRP